MISLLFELLPFVMIFSGLTSHKSHKPFHITLNMLQKTGFSVKQNLETSSFCLYNKSESFKSCP